MDWESLGSLIVCGIFSSLSFGWWKSEERTGGSWDGFSSGKQSRKVKKGNGRGGEATCETNKTLGWPREKEREGERQEVGAWDWNEGLESVSKVGEGHVGMKMEMGKRVKLLWHRREEWNWELFLYGRQVEWLLSESSFGYTQTNSNDKCKVLDVK